MLPLLWPTKKHITKPARRGTDTDSRRGREKSSKSIEASCHAVGDGRKKATTTTKKTKNNNSDMANGPGCFVNAMSVGVETQ